MARSTPFGVMPRMKSYTVAAIFQIGMTTFDNTFIFMPLSEAHSFFNLDGQASVIEVYVADPDNIDAMRQKIEAAQGRPMIDTDWRQLNRSFFDVLAVESNVMFAILTLIMLVAALNIVSGLIMLVQDKARAIAVLRTMGATRGAIMRIFLIIGATIGFVGTACGPVLGLLVAEMSSRSAKVELADRRNLFPSEFYFLSQLPSRVEPRDVVAVAALASSCRSRRRSIRRGGRPSSIRSRRCVMNDQARRVLRSRRRTPLRTGETRSRSRAAPPELSLGQSVALSRRLAQASRRCSMSPGSGRPTQARCVSAALRPRR